MAALAPTNVPQRHVLGDLVARFYDLSGNDADTFTPAQSGIRQVVITPTTTVAVGATVSSGVITFHAGGAWAAKVGVISKEG